MTKEPNIYAREHGYRIVIERPGISYSAHVAYRTASRQGQRNAPDITAAEKSTALAKAITLRNRFLAAHKAYTRSNTGHAGISETVKWSRGRPYPSFQCNHNRNHRARFYFSTLGERDKALQSAITWRQQFSHV